MDIDLKDNQIVNLAKLTEDSDRAITAIERHVVNGGSLIDLCKAWDVAYMDVVKWIRNNQELTKIYDQAVNDGNEWVKATILRELIVLSTGGVDEFHDKQGHIIPPSEWSDDMKSRVESIKMKRRVDKDGNVEDEFNVKVWSKLKAIELFGKNKGYFVDKIDVSGKLTLEDLVQGSRDVNE